VRLKYSCDVDRDVSRLLPVGMQERVNLALTLGDHFKQRNQLSQTYLTLMIAGVNIS